MGTQRRLERILGPLRGTVWPVSPRGVSAISLGSYGMCGRAARVEGEGFSGNASRPTPPLDAMVF